MKVENVIDTDIDLKKELEEVNKKLEAITTEKANLQEQITTLEGIINERDMTIYNLAIKIAKL